MSQEPEINMEETIGKVVGKRKLRDPVRYGMNLQTAGAEFIPRLHIPKGVFRFHTFEEADQWMTRMLSRPRN